MDKNEGSQINGMNFAFLEEAQREKNDRKGNFIEKYGRYYRSVLGTNVEVTDVISSIFYISSFHT